MLIIESLVFRGCILRHFDVTVVLYVTGVVYKAYMTTQSCDILYSLLVLQGKGLLKHRKVMSYLYQL